ncbi:MAG: hypothetical protein AB2A00_42635 [Myxococcota bacterium]
MKRVWDIDALTCSKSGATLAALAEITDPDEVARYLAHMGEGSSGLSRGPPETAA